MLKITNKGVNFLWLLLIICSCRSTPSAQYIADQVGRPEIESPCISNGDGTCFRNGELLQTENMLCGESVYLGKMQTHLEKMEKFKFLCEQYNQCDSNKKSYSK